MKTREASGALLERPVVEWLLEKDEPSVRSLTLVDLLARRADDPEVRASRARIGKVGWAEQLLRPQKPEGFFEARAPKTLSEYVNFLYFPIYQATNWRALVLSDLGLTSSDPRIRRLADQVFNYKLRLSSPFNFFHEEVCIAGNTARMLTRFGYGDDRRVRMLYDWLLADQRDDGGWNCSPGTPGTLDAWEALAAFAAVPKPQRPAAMDRAIERGAEFYLKRKLLEEGRRYAPWYRLHYPNHYYYDLLVGLDVLTELGFAGDRRLEPALALLRAKRRGSGRWPLERIHPDVGPGIDFGTDPKKVRPLALEEAGRPSKWLTFKALRVLKRVEVARRGN